MSNLNEISFAGWNTNEENLQMGISQLWPKPINQPFHRKLREMCDAENTILLDTRIKL